VHVATKFPSLVGPAVHALERDTWLLLRRSEVLRSLKSVNKFIGQLAVSSLVLALELFAMSRISLTVRQASKGILLHYENLFGLHGRRESFLD
jgi:hypothetical protein